MAVLNIAYIKLKMHVCSPVLSQGTFIVQNHILKHKNILFTSWSGVQSTK